MQVLRHACNTHHVFAAHAKSIHMWTRRTSKLIPAVRLFVSWLLCATVSFVLGWMLHTFSYMWLCVALPISSLPCPLCCPPAQDVRGAEHLFKQQMHAVCSSLLCLLMGEGWDTLELPSAADVFSHITQAHLCLSVCFEGKKISQKGEQLSWMGCHAYMTVTWTTVHYNCMDMMSDCVQHLT